MMRFDNHSFLFSLRAVCQPFHDECCSCLAHTGSRLMSCRLAAYRLPFFMVGRLPPVFDVDSQL